MGDCFEKTTDSIAPRPTKAVDRVRIARVSMFNRIGRVSVFNRIGRVSVFNWHYLIQYNII